MTAVLTRARRLLGRFRSPDHKRRADPYRRRSWMQPHDAVLRKGGCLSALGQAGRGTRAIRSPDRAVRSSDTPDPPVTPTNCLTAIYAGQESNAPGRSGFPRRRSLPVSPERSGDGPRRGAGASRRPVPCDSALDDARGRRLARLGRDWMLDLSRCGWVACRTVCRNGPTSGFQRGAPPGFSRSSSVCDRDVLFEIAAHEVGIGPEGARHARLRAIIGP